MKLHARDIGCGSEVWIADHVQIGETRKAKRFTQPAPSGRLKIRDEIRVVPLAPRRRLAPYSAPQLISEIERAQQRSLVFARAVQAVRALVGRVKIRMSLKDYVRLPSDKPRRRLRMREHRYHFGRIGLLARGVCGACCTTRAFGRS